MLPYLSWMSCPIYLLSTAVVVPSRLSCLSCPVLAAIFWPFCPCFLSWLYYPVSLSNFPVPVLLSQLPVLAVLSKLSYTSCPAWLYCTSRPIPIVLSLLPSPRCPVLAAQPRHPLSTAILMSLSCPGSPILCLVQAHPSRLTSKADM